MRALKTGVCQTVMPITMYPTNLPKFCAHITPTEILIEYIEYIVVELECLYAFSSSNNCDVCTNVENHSWELTDATEYKIKPLSLSLSY